MMRRLVRRQVILASIDSKSRVCDAVRVTPDDGAEVRRGVDVRLETIKSKHDVRVDAGRIGHGQ